MSSLFVKRADAVQKAVSERSLTGYKRKGRLFNQRVGEDLVSVVEFRLGRKYPDENFMLTVWMGLYVPEAAQKILGTKFDPDTMVHEYQCPIRTSLGTLQGIGDYKGYNEKYIDLSKLTTDKKIQKAADEICGTIEKQYFPLVAELSTVERILTHLSKYVKEKKVFETNLSLVTAMLYGARGDDQKARDVLQAYYDETVKGFETKYYLKGHLEYIAEIAASLGLALKTIEIPTIEEWEKHGKQEP